MPHRDDFEDFDKDTEMLVAQIGKYKFVCFHKYFHFRQLTQKCHRDLTEILHSIFLTNRLNSESDVNVLKYIVLFN